MDEKAYTEMVNCIDMDIHPVSIMNHVSVKTAQSMLAHMRIEYEEGLVPDAYLIAFHEEFCRDRSWIIHMIPKFYLYFLMEIWDSDRIEMDGIRWDMLKHLKRFGLVTYRKGNRRQGIPSEIYIVSSMKNHFYFYLKSRDAEKEMDHYERMENAFLGMMYYYGIASLPDLHRIFCQALKEETDYDAFYHCVKCRSDLWAWGLFLKDRQKEDYFMNHNVESAELSLVMIREHKDLPYKSVSYDDLAYVRFGYGIDNRWHGVSELGSYLVNDMQMSYYRSTVLVHTFITAIQNGTDLKQLLDKLAVISFSDTKDRKNVEKYVSIMYEHIPVFEFKGHSRSEYGRKYQELESRKSRSRFHMIPGGKK
ncbi:MAG: hypothetical protein IJH60_08130 [Eubacterium sp.]|nr:hypothetical protein [Eubacterium sp.]